MIDPQHIGTTFPEFTFEVERGQIRRLAQAISDPNPIYQDRAAAQAAGYPDLPAPPTLPTLFGLWGNPTLLDTLETIGARLSQVLHGEQEYVYHSPVYPGDVVTGSTRLATIRSRKGGSGAMELVTLETTYVNQRDEPVISDRTVVVVQGEQPDARRETRDTRSHTAADRQPMMRVASVLSARSFEQVAIGDALPPIAHPPITHNQLVRYSGASGDFNPLHTDTQIARAAGLDDVIAHGMLVMGFVGQLASDFAGPTALRRFGVRFRSMTQLGDAITCTGGIAAKDETNGEGRVRCEVQATNERGDVKLTGSFECALPRH